jgi:lipopolysaccharide/colanic/teichoic acid biosynthesis glycosyltransferase
MNEFRFQSFTMTNSKVKSKAKPQTAFFPNGTLFKSALFLTMALIWVLALGAMDLSLTHLPLELGTFGVLASILTLWCLDSLDYFAFFHPVAQADSLVTVLVVAPVAGWIAKSLVMIIFSVSIARFGYFLLTGPLIALTVYGIQVLAGRAYVRSGARRKICLFTSSAETDKVLKAFRTKGLSKFYEPILPIMFQSAPKKEELAWVVISRSELHRFEKRESVIETMLSGAEIVDYRELIARLTGHLDLDQLDLWMFLYESVRKNTLGRFYSTLRTVLERILSGCLLLIFTPFLLLWAICLKIVGRGPVVEYQMHLGHQRVPFKIWKFRGKSLLSGLLQLSNVVRGEMSWIGPKPDRAEFYAETERLIPLFPIRLLVRPGLTGWAQVMGSRTVSTLETKRNLEFDLFYLQRMSPKMDFFIILRTLALTLRLQKPTRSLAATG